MTATRQSGNKSRKLLSSDGVALQLFGVRLLGVSPENGRKLIITVVFILAVWLISRGLRAVTARLWPDHSGKRIEFWTRQGIQLVTALIEIIGILSIWFDNPGRLATFLGLFTAGLAFALQKVVTALAAYFVLLRGKTFNVGDRIRMGGVRGDVINLGFIQTTIMEMGEPPPVQNEEPAVWVQARQYTGRVVTVTNDKIFDEPVYNYSRDFPYLWEEMALPVSYQSDRKRAEEILLGVARKHTVKINDLGEDAIKELERRYFVRRSDLGPRVYFRLTDNWLEMSLRFLVHDAGVREMKDAMSRDIIDQLDQAGIGIASGTYEIVGVPPVHVVMDGGNGSQDHSQDGHDSRPSIIATQ